MHRGGRFGYTGHKTAPMKIFKKAHIAITFLLTIIILALVYANAVVLPRKPAQITPPNRLNNTIWETFGGKAQELGIAQGVSIFIRARLISYNLSPQGVIGYFRFSDGRIFKTHIDRMAKTSFDFAEGKGLTIPYGTGIDEKLREKAGEILSYIKASSRELPASIGISALASEGECLKTANPEPAICRRIGESGAGPVTAEEFEQAIRSMGTPYQGEDPGERWLIGTLGKGGEGLQLKYTVQVNGQRPREDRL